MLLGIFISYGVVDDEVGGVDDDDGGVDEAVSEDVCLPPQSVQP